jgi:hypothetical protein
METTTLLARASHALTISNEYESNIQYLFRLLYTLSYGKRDHQESKT